ncbi:hypothetical protein QYR02_15240 [Microbacterium maritypicum]|uniref:hypothetical protein n=1 Tax=Microbacterium maritypicum TaxID=33918 RepID=UPI002672F3C1|nr:hypothetical protein [Microbacterium liquefaciens]WKT88780.1 hypothetical protein QYR02_15240 [Microbacterium liquefaciens]
MWALADDDVVVRGGIFNDPELILEALEDAIDMGYGPVLSVFLGKLSENGDVDASVAAACKDGKVPHGKIRLTRVKNLRDSNFELTQDTSEGQPECHFHVHFPEAPTSVDASRFIGCFDEPIKNPAKESAS